MAKIVNFAEVVCKKTVGSCERREQSVEEMLCKDSGDVKVFVATNALDASKCYNAFGNAAATVVFNQKTNSIVISFKDGGEKHSARDVARELWGKFAGGWSATAMSPRGWQKSDFEVEEEFERAVEVVEALYS